VIDKLYEEYTLDGELYFTCLHCYINSDNAAYVKSKKMNSIESVQIHRFSRHFKVRQIESELLSTIKRTCQLME
jgi:hypothetical protein